MSKAKKLIEVAMPIKEISAESVRDKSIRHGHISTLHLWWARRPLPVCRAVVFASIVPDPLDEECPQAFKDAVTDLLGSDIRYAPYDDIPYTASYDPMKDDLRNRLLMFIGKFSPKCQENMLKGKTTPAKDQLDDSSLIKWDNKNNKEILGKARKLIWVAYNADRHPDVKYEVLKNEFDVAYKKIKEAEAELYGIVDRHKETKEVKTAEAILQTAIEDFQKRMPSVFDPFAGGGAIPLEAARLGCRSYGNDINPVAHIIEKGSVEFPQKYGKPIRFSKDEFMDKYGKEGLELLVKRNIPFGDVIEIPNRLSFDVEYWAKKLLNLTEKEVGHLYPADKSGNKPIAYYWVRTATCSNPSCKAEIPLLKQFYLANTKSKKVYLNPIIDGTIIEFEIKEGDCYIEGWNRGNLTCPCCGAITSSKQIKEQANKEGLGLKQIALITESKNGKAYEISKTNKDIKDFILDEALIPTERMQKIPDLISGRGWNIEQWNQMFTKRQLKVLQTLILSLNKIQRSSASEYDKVLITYLSLWIDRIAVANTSLGRWHVTGEKMEHPFSRQAIAMIFDFPESNPFCTSSGSASNQLEWIVRYIDSESFNSFWTILQNASSGEKNQFEQKQLTAVVTDPPYYDAIAYADISDFFYVWLKRTVGDIYPLNFATPQTPKTEECTALKHHHNNDVDEAKRHFEKKLTAIFDAIEHQTSDIVSIMFAHQSTEAWTTLCNSILGARMNITGSWPMDTEMANRSLGLVGAALESSVTVSCRPSQRSGYGNYKKVKQAIEEKVNEEVESLYKLGFRGADLLTACFGQAVSEFGKYESVEKADGSEVTVGELLEMARNAAFNALLRGFDGDEYTRFYIGWLQMNGMGDTDFDDAAKFTRIGMNVNVAEIFHHNLLIKEGNKQHLGSYKERIKNENNLGENAPLIDQVHLAMLLWKRGNRPRLLQLIKAVGANVSDSFWRILASLKEILPDGDDLTQVSGLLSNRDDLIQSSQQEIKNEGIQTELKFE
jgi:adenine-specific DNA methylase